MNALGWTAVGVLLTFSIFLANVIYKTGHLSARVEEIERWRTDVRKDMHEISDQIKDMSVSVQNLVTIIEERTERRLSFREPSHSERRT